MSRSCTYAVFAAAMAAAAWPGAAFAQSSPPSTVQNRWPEPPRPGQAEPAPAPTPPPPAPRRQEPEARTPAERPPAPERPVAARPKPVQPSGSAVTCNGVFAKDSTHIKLAMKYDSRNVVFGEVDGPDGTKLPGSILFPQDPKRRLEVLWTNEAARTGTSLVAINGKSQWGGPKGLKLGLSIQQLEKLNGKAFRLSGFGADGSASVIGWEGGALNSLPGGCKVGVRLMVGPKATPEARTTVGGDKELVSSDPNVRAVQPAVAEILIGY